MYFRYLNLSLIFKICASVIIVVIIILTILRAVYAKKKDKKKIKVFTIAIASLSAFLLLTFTVYFVYKYLNLKNYKSFHVYSAGNMYMHSNVGTEPPEAEKIAREEEEVERGSPSSELGSPSSAQKRRSPAPSQSPVSLPVPEEDPEAESVTEVEAHERQSPAVAPAPTVAPEPEPVTEESGPSVAEAEKNAREERLFRATIQVMKKLNNEGLKVERSEEGINQIEKKILERLKQERRTNAYGLTDADLLELEAMMQKPSNANANTNAKAPAAAVQKPAKQGKVGKR